jgi:hypothetical protein
MNFPFLKAKERLIRIMGTFDLATGHADTFDELLDSLESELRDVLGHYREALKPKQGEPVQVSPLEFVTMVMEKEHLVGKPLFWAEWPNKEKNT